MGILESRRGLLITGKRNILLRSLLLIFALLALACGIGLAQTSQQGTPPDSAGQSQGKEFPDAPDEAKKKEEAPGTMQQMEERSKWVANLAERQAEAQLMRARNWESTWITGVYIGKDQPRVTPTAKQRREIYLRQTLTTPGAYLKRMFAAGIDQAEGTPRQWDDGWGGYAERFASREGQFITANTLAAVGNAKLGYEVRYDKCKCKGAWPRTRHAILRNLLTYDRSEEHLRPQVALYGGAFGAGMVAAAWKPDGQNVFAQGAIGMAGQLGWGTLLNFVTEFSTEINRKQGVR
jgi:hypothetical protein